MSPNPVVDALGAEEVVLSDASLPSAWDKAVDDVVPHQDQARDAYQQMYRVADDLRQLRLNRDAAFRALADAHHETMFRLALMIEMRAGGDSARILRIAALSALLAESIDWSPSACEMLSRAAPLADIGLCMVPEDATPQTGALNESYRDHTRQGARLLGGTDVPVLQMAATIALSHHERWDGAGYPSRLARDAIPVEARIFAVADYFDTITLGPDDERLPDSIALRAVRAERGKRLDPVVAEALLDNAVRLCGARDFVNVQGAADGFDWPEGWWRVF